MTFQDSLKAYKAKGRVSYSEIVLHGTCAFRHKLAYIEKIKLSGANIYSAFGNATHKALEFHLFDSTEEKIKVFDDEFRNIINEIRSNDDEVKEEDIAAFTEQGHRLLGLVLDEMKTKFGNFQIVGAEQVLEQKIEDFKLDTMYFKGIIDLVIMDEAGTLHIIDFKSSTWGWDSKKKSNPIVVRQLVLYKHFFSIITGVPLDKIETHFILLKRTAKKNPIEIVSVTSGTKRVQNAIKWMVDAVTNIYKLNFIKNRFNCTYCEYKGTEYCPLSSGIVTKKHKFYGDNREKQKEKAIIEEMVEIAKDDIEEV